MSELKIKEQTATHLKLQLIPVDVWVAGFLCLILGLFWTCATALISLQSPGASIGLLPGILWIGVGIYVLLGAGHIVTCTFDKPSKQMILTGRGIRDKEAFECSLSDIKTVQIESGSNFTYRICLQLFSQAAVPLTSHYNKNFTAKQKIAIAIAQFLNLNTKHLISSSHRLSLSFGNKKIELFKKKDTKEELAIAEIKQAIASNPKDIKLYLELAQMLDLQGLREEAVVILKQGRDVAIATNAHFQQREQIEEKIQQWSRF